STTHSPGTSAPCTVNRHPSPFRGTCRINEKPHPSEESQGWGHLSLYRFPVVRRRSLREKWAWDGGSSIPWACIVGFFISTPVGPYEGWARWLDVTRDGSRAGDSAGAVGGLRSHCSLRPCGESGRVVVLGTRA